MQRSLSRSRSSWPGRRSRRAPYAIEAPRAASRTSAARSTACPSARASRCSTGIADEHDHRRRLHRPPRRRLPDARRAPQRRAHRPARLRARRGTASASAKRPRRGDRARARACSTPTSRRACTPPSATDLAAAIADHQASARDRRGAARPQPRARRSAGMARPSGGWTTRARAARVEDERETASSVLARLERPPPGARRSISGTTQPGESLEQQRTRLGDVRRPDHLLGAGPGSLTKSVIGVSTNAGAQRGGLDARRLPSSLFIACVKPMTACFVAQ